MCMTLDKNGSKSSAAFVETFHHQLTSHRLATGVNLADPCRVSGSLFRFLEPISYVNAGTTTVLPLWSGGPQGSHQCNPDTTAYTGGSMAGLAFGLLFLGLIVGATFLYFFKVRNTDGGSNEIKMVFVNSRRE
ncbi:hypothetical protein ScPMuIL_000608 [Solemya velum]